jgi:hypothetical protein
LCGDVVAGNEGRKSRMVARLTEALANAVTGRQRQPDTKTCRGRVAYGGRGADEDICCLADVHRRRLSRNLAMAKDQSAVEFIDAADEVAYSLVQLDELIQETQELEQCLVDEERKWGIAPDRSKPIVERMAAFGASQETVDAVAKRLEALALRFDL